MKIQHTRLLAAIMLSSCFTGCTSLLAPIHGIPVRDIPGHLLGERRADYTQVPLALLRMEQPEDYTLDKGDILGIYIEGVMPPQNGEDQPVSIPPVHFPEAGSDLPPAVGYPIPVRDDGTLPLPLVKPLNVRGKTLTEVEKMVRKAFVDDEKILQKGRDQILVTLIKERTTRVVVIREDDGTNAALAGGSRQFGNAQEVISGTERQGTGYTLDMPAYKNDLMHALAETGGLPGLNAKSEVKIIKGGHLAPEERRQMMMQMFMDAGDKCECWTEQCDRCDVCENGTSNDRDPFSVTIPLRVRPGEMPNFKPEDIVLEEGDMVFIEARDTEVFYTGGLLPGGQYPLPRDYDLDVIGAMSVAGTGLGGSGGSSGGGVGGGIISGGFGGATPTQLYVVRKGPCGQEFTIAVDLKEAFNDPSQRILVQPGDTLILRYKPHEEVLNFGLITFFTFGVSNLFN